MLPYQYVTTKIASDRMIGVDTPSFIETQEVKMKGYATFDPILTLMGALGGIISGAIFSLGKIVIGSIDTVLSWVGLPYGTFSGFVNLVTTIFTALISTLVSVISMISTALLLITTFFSTVLTFVSYIVSGILFFGVYLFSVPLQIIGLIMAVINGTAITFMGIYLDFTPYQGLMIALKTILPLLGSIYLSVWLIWGNIEMRGEPEATEVIGRIFQLFGIMRDIYSNVFWIFNKIRAELLNVYGFLKSHIPFLGSTPTASED